MTTNSYDIIIIGGGIAGLYKAHQALKKNPNKKILLLEATDRLGGRIHTYHNNTTYKSGIEAGAGRFHKGHRKLTNLIKELGLDHLIIPISTNKQYIPTPKTPQPNSPSNFYLDQVLKSAKNTPKNQIQNQTFLEYAKKVLPPQNPSPEQTILDSFGYSSELTDMNAYDTINLINLHYKIKNYYVLKGGMEQIVTHLVSRLTTYPNFQYHLREPVINIQPQLHNNSQIQIQIKTPKSTYIANKCICALIKEDLEKIPLFRPIHPILKKIKNLPLCRIYCKFPPNPQTNQVWFHDLPKMTTNNNLRYIIPINPDPKEGTIMISYTDNKYATQWHNIKTTQGTKALNQTLQTQLQEIFPNYKIPLPTHTKMFYWKHGVAYFQPSLDSTKDLDKIRHPFPNLPLEICGENYSPKNAQWVEGALE